MSGRRVDLTLQQLLASGADCIGEIAIAANADGTFALTHRDDRDRADVTVFHDPENAVEIARFDDTGAYRPLKTAPNLRHGWRLILNDLPALGRALENFYPARLAVLDAWQQTRLTTTPLRTTLERQSGMYRVASRITEEQLNALVGTFCRSDGGCLRTILWKRDAAGTRASTLLPSEKFDPNHDQMGRVEDAMPLLCPEGCNLLVGAARDVVKGERSATSE